MLVGVAAIVGGLWCLWGRRPWRTVVEVNGHVMTAGELRVRGASLLADAKKTQHLLVPAAREADALRHYEIKAAQLWIFKTLMLDEAVARNLKATPGEAKEQVKLMEKRLEGRGMTVDEYFKNGPLPEEVLRREFDESVLLSKLLKQEVEDKIKLDSDEITKFQAELQKRAMELKKPLKRKIDRKFAIDAMRAQSYREGTKKFYESLRAKAEVRSPEYPELESFQPSAADSIPSLPTPSESQEEEKK